MKKTFLVFVLIVCINVLRAQPADTRVCNCFSSAVPSTFAEGTKVMYGTIGIIPRKGDELRPTQSQPVKFVIPKLTPKQGCGAVYKLYITDESGAIVYETEDSHNEFSYTFEQCNKRYDVRVLASVTGEGNCTRRTNFYINPVCNTNTCNCDPMPANGKVNTTSINLGIEGKLICGITTATRRSYTFQYRITNKSRCRMVIESVGVLGETISGSTDGIPAGGRTAAFNTGMSTPLSQTAPMGTSTNVTVRYSVNGRSCTATIKIPYQSCR